MIMLGTISNAFSGLTNASKRLQNSANNLSNVLTSAFKKGQVITVDSKAGGTGVNSISKVNTHGSFLPTNNPLDLAIQGNGFFQVANPNGSTSFTRSGSFSLDGTYESTARMDDIALLLSKIKNNTSIKLRLKIKDQKETDYFQFEMDNVYMLSGGVFDSIQLQ